jgi:hypothetical protein
MCSGSSIALTAPQPRTAACVYGGEGRGGGLLPHSHALQHVCMGEEGGGGLLPHSHVLQHVCGIGHTDCALLYIPESKRTQA